MLESSMLRFILRNVTMPLVLVYQLVSPIISFFIPRWLRKKKDIGGQRVLITGAGSGLGRQLAIKFSQHAVCLILVDINKRSLLETEKLLDRRSTVFIYECDISDYKKVQEMARKVEEDAGDVDILVNNAGVVSGKYLMDLPAEKIVKTLEVNALAHFWTCKAFLPSMVSRNRGHLVSVLSIAGKVGCPRLTDYCASKYAALGFAESLELELRERGVDRIRITIVCPTHMDTELFRGMSVKFAPTLSPEYVAQEIVLGVLEERQLIFLPSYLKSSVLIKEIMPKWLTIKLYEITGEIKAMSGFTGKEQNGVTSSDKPTKCE